MSLVFQTDQFLADIATHSCESWAEKFRWQVEASDSHGSLSIRSPWFWVKPCPGSFRLVATPRVELGKTVWVFVRLLPRRKKDVYDRCRKVWKNDREAFLNFADPLIDDEQVRGFVERRLADGLRDDDLPEPTPAETDWLYAFGGSGAGASDDDLFVFEAEPWVAASGERRLLDYRAELRLLVDRLGTAARPVGDLVRSEAHDLAIVTRALPDASGVLLWDVVAPADDAAVAAARRALDQAVEEAARRGEGPATLGRRSYPLLLATDHAIWTAIQDDRHSNLALSQEEADILAVVREIAHGTPRFPLFVNGRAGSGKSTMLLHLAGDLVTRQLQVERDLPQIEQVIPPPLFLTSSRPLSDDARGKVEALLELSYTRLMEKESPDPGVDPEAARDAARLATKRVTGSAFRVFREYLLELLPESVRRARFPSGERIGYAVFARLWEEYRQTRPAVKDYSAEFVWHAIRSFVKGKWTREDGFLDSQRYATLPEAERGFSTTVYENIYEHVWKAWYEKLTAGRQADGDRADKRGEPSWDDQDLARAVLEMDRPLPGHPAVLCDEAQDFTALELRLILGLSLFSRRSVPRHHLPNIPFAFAGDPFQTLNPTGFRWDSIKAMIHTELIEPLVERAVESHDGSSFQFDSHYRELTRNFRSAEAVVKFCNRIQLLRSRVMDLRVEPQTSAASGGAQVLGYFKTDDRRIQDQLNRRHDVTVLVNCGDGGEASYVADPSHGLHGLIKTDQEAGAPRGAGTAVVQPQAAESGAAQPENVMGPIYAKGLEMDRVILYRFGADAPQVVREHLARLRNPNAPRHERSLDENERVARNLTFAYFFNRLYVAASRARKQLHIVDTPDAIKDFWWFARDEERFWEVFGEEGRGHWEPHLTLIFEGTDEHLSDDPEDLNQIFEQAESLETLGREGRQSGKLVQAAMKFERVGGHATKAVRCRAMAHEFDERWERAWEGYCSVGAFGDAVRCLWTGGYFRRLADWGEGRDDLQRDVRVRAAGLLAVESPDPEAVINLLETLARDAAPFADQAEWHPRISKLSEGVRSGPPDSLVSDRWAELHRSLTRLRDAGFHGLPPEALLDAAWRGRRYERAVELAERFELTDRPAYFESKARTLPYPAKLDPLGKWLRRVGIGPPADPVREMIVRAFDEGGGAADLDRLKRRLVAEALAARDRPGDAVAVFTDLGGDRVGRNEWFGEVREVLADPTAHLDLRRGLLRPFLEKALGGGDGAGWKWARERTRPLFEQAGNDFRPVVRAAFLALVEDRRDFPKASSKIRREIANFIADELTGGDLIPGLTGEEARCTASALDRTGMKAAHAKFLESVRLRGSADARRVIEELSGPLPVPGKASADDAPELFPEGPFRFGKCDVRLVPEQTEAEARAR